VPNKVTVLKNGVWDILHIGHLNVLRAAAGFGTLVVGVATDEYVREYKDYTPVMNYHDRAALVGALRMVDVVVPYCGPGDTTAIYALGVSIVVIDEHFGIGETPHARRQWEARKKIRALGVQYVVVPYTSGISSTAIKEQLRENH